MIVGFNKDCVENYMETLIDTLVHDDWVINKEKLKGADTYTFFCTTWTSEGINIPDGTLHEI